MDFLFVFSILSKIVFDIPTRFYLKKNAPLMVYKRGLLLYLKNKRTSDFKQWLKYALGILRFATVSFLAFLLLSPLLKTEFIEVEKPIIAAVNGVAAGAGAKMTPKQYIYHNLRPTKQEYHRIGVKRTNHFKKKYNEK